ncbi:MAG: 4Fe-4S dicluster domain-containing protein [Bacteroidaceae bacterium]
MKNNKTIMDNFQLTTGVDIKRCYQCGKCTAGCVLAEEMDLPPNYIMRLLQTDTSHNFEKVLSSKAIWLCLNCENCVGRCPMEIDIPKVMDYMRELSLQQNKQHPAAKSIIAFHKSFLDSIKYTGHLYELGLIADFKTRTLHLMQDVKLAPKMFIRGKLNLLPEMGKNMQGIKAIFSRTQNK